MGYGAGLALVAPSGRFLGGPVAGVEWLGVRRALAVGAYAESRC
jgi:hypothetical protein